MRARHMVGTKPTTAYQHPEGEICGRRHMVVIGSNFPLLWGVLQCGGSMNESQRSICCSAVC